ncbi:MAG TPA: DUF2950 domain-containing protein [Burkholderiales bacterium]|nr:DUF2950 domain-containing protein [Burkholderiales bacterium]
MRAIKATLGTVLRRRWTAILAATLFAACASPVALAADKQKTFGTPEDAAKALGAASRAGDVKALESILGPGSANLIRSGDAVADRRGRERFAKAYEEASKVERQGDAKAILLIGKDDWPMPIPIVKGKDGWRFDARQGREEVLNRRVGRNELSAVQAMLAYVDAQREYYLRNPRGDKLLHYAQKFGSAPGKRDGLYFPTKAGEPPSPLGPLFAKAKAAGYGKDEDGLPDPYFGYRYRILKRQGPDATGGAYDYVVQGRMIGGFALVAWPASYGNSGVMTFIVNHEGVVYEKDLGPETAAAVGKITRFNPDKTWKRH